MLGYWAIEGVTLTVWFGALFGALGVLVSNCRLLVWFRGWSLDRRCSRGMSSYLEPYSPSTPCVVLGGYHVLAY
jgi:hypothetical protein